MKPSRLLRRLQQSFALVSILAALVAGLPGHAQTTAPPAPATNAVSDALRFPAHADLPGKPPPTVWSGLARIWEQRRRHFQLTAAQDTGAVVFLGDSITQGWTSLAKDFPNLKVANRGISGDISSGVLYRLKEDVLDLDPAAIILLIGTNDLGNGADPADTADNINEILQAIKKYNPKLKVIVCKVMPRGEQGQSDYAGKIKKLDASLEQLVKGNPNFAICDTWTPLADDQGGPIAADFVPDRLHLNPAGYAVWKNALDPVLVKMDLENPKSQ